MSMEAQYLADNVAGTATPLGNGVVAKALMDDQRRLVVVGGGSGFGDATSANQTTEIARLTSILAALPAALDASGGLKVAEQTAAAAEDEGNGVFALALKPIIGSQYSWPVKAMRAAASLVIAGAPCQVRKIYFVNRTGADLFVQLRNLTSAPGGATAVDDTDDLEFDLPNNAILSEELGGANGHNFATGCTVTISSARGTFTSATVTYGFVEYVS